MSFFEELKRRHVVKTAILYAVSSWLILQVADLLFDLMGLPGAWLRLVLALLLLGFPLVLIFSWVYEMTPEGLKRDKDVDRSRPMADEAGHKINRVIAVLLIVAIATVVIDRLIPEQAGTDSEDPDFDGPAVTEEAGDSEGSSSVAAGKFAPPPSRSIAVLPFANMSRDPDNEYFADGLSEEILNFLADVPDLQVTARTSSFQFKDQNVDIREVADALGVANVLEGSVRRDGDRARITAQLIRSADGYHLWSEAYDRTLENIFEVQTDIAESVTRALGVVLDERQRERMLEAGVRDVEAFIYFQRGLRRFFEAHANEIDMDMLGESAELFTKAIELEPRFAAAYHMRSDYSAHIMTMVGPTEEEHQAAAQRHAEDLDHAIRYARNPHARALIEVDKVLVSTNWRALPEHFEAALASPTCDQGTWVEVAPVFGFAEQTLARAERMIVCDPLNFYNHYEAAMTLMVLRRPEEAMQAARRGLEVAPDHPFLELAVVRSLIAQGRGDDALEYAKSITADNRDLATAVSLAALGEIDQANALAAEIIARSGPWYRNFMVLNLAAITGDHARANETAAWFDGLPGGPLMLAGIVLECGCGAPFDLDAAPTFGQLIAAAGVDWPPPVLLDYPAMRPARAPD